MEQDSEDLPACDCDYPFMACSFSPVPWVASSCEWTCEDGSCSMADADVESLAISKGADFFNKATM